MASLHYQKNCLMEPIIPSMVFGGVFSALDAMRGLPFTPYGVGTYMGGIYVYSAMQCPMEAISGRRSWMHNVISGGTMGYLGVSSGRLGIPFINTTTFFYRYPQASPPMVAFAVYGGMGGFLAALGGKPL